MKKWIICLGLSIVMAGLGLIYFINVTAMNNCLDAGGHWLGAVEGCGGVNAYRMEKLFTPLALAIFLGIILALTATLSRMHTMYHQWSVTKK